ncbi:phage terminase large subunit [Swaminathania salitolerans]|uniref:DNA-packaging protein n=1 Tax=Swaminathania salitolerans TaxID=182838 RepID=A0A511BSF1_9PROT|nr:phage terminase large subunit [Swaminathania salitolerans]GBQ09759.1 phage DNA packaging protein [Swaminathania salitolerans LMG 21291]GEL00858.1 DNA-packaging protein [Swaminathania salitolerans]
MNTSREAFRLTPIQEQANRLLAGEARHIFLKGGSRSGKTFVLLRAMIVRALRVSRSRHGVFRHRQIALRASVIQDTFPKVMRCCFPETRYRWDGSSNRAVFRNGSSILFGGLDDAGRTEKILGLEFATIYLNEASQISYAARNMLLTRLAQRSALRTREYIDANPPTTDHWLYALFEAGIEPRSGMRVADPSLYATMRLNPADNRDNLSDTYLQQLEALPERERKRFLLGEYLTVIEGALWRLDMIRREAPPDEAGHAALIARMRRIVVAVDPSGASGPGDIGADEIGIVVAGVDAEGIGHVLEDCSIRDSPMGWARRVVTAAAHWRADRIVAERNFGGALVEATLRSVDPQAALLMVTASHGKVARAEPVAALYEQGRVIHHGRFPELESQLCLFSSRGFGGATSPDRADALIWALSELMIMQKPGKGQWHDQGWFSLSR